MTPSASSFPEVFLLRNQIALITGGATGIGRAIAESMYAAGAYVVLAGRREAELSATAAALGERASIAVYDVTRTDLAASLINSIEGKVGPVTCLVNNAGINMKKPAVDTTIEEFETILRTHVLGSHALVRAVVPGMLERKAGNLIFIASMASLFGLPGVSAYTAAKSAFVGMVRSYATEFSPHGVRVNAIAPGWIDTAMMRTAMEGDPSRKQKVLGRTPMARFGSTDDIGWAATFLASPAAKFITGVTLPVDGGASIGF